MNEPLDRDPPVANPEIEMEWKLAFVGDSPSQALESLESFPTREGLRLERDSEILLRDVYFDLPDRALSARRIALRLREKNGRMRATLKGAGVTDESGLSARPEFEVDFVGAATIDSLRAVLKEWGVDPGTAASREPGVEKPDGHSVENPTRLLEGELGVEVVQERSTRRTLFHLREDRVEESDVTLAEVAFDRVVYDSPAGSVIHFEIEVEMQSAGESSQTEASECVARVEGWCRELRARFGSDLIPFGLDKLSFGAWIARHPELRGGERDDPGTGRNSGASGERAFEPYDSGIRPTRAAYRSANRGRATEDRTSQRG